MLSITPCPLPDNALLEKYVRRGAYTDCFRTDVSGRVSHARYVNAFYTTPLFKLERLILKLAFSIPSSDADAALLADGSSDGFAAWNVEARGENQLLLCDINGRTRSWLMVAPAEGMAREITRLYFGSAVVPKRPWAHARGRFEFGFSVLIKLHRLYSVLLLYSARSKLIDPKY